MCFKREWVRRRRIGNKLRQFTRSASTPRESWTAGEHTPKRQQAGLMIELAEANGVSAIDTFNDVLIMTDVPEEMTFDAIDNQNETSEVDPEVAEIFAELQNCHDHRIYPVTTEPDLDDPEVAQRLALGRQIGAGLYY